jgi:hypothetical protein
MEPPLETVRPAPTKPIPHRHLVHRTVHPLPVLRHPLAHRALNAGTHPGNRAQGRPLHQLAQTQGKPLPLRDSPGPHLRGVGGGRDAAGRNRLRRIRPDSRGGVKGHWVFTLGHQQRPEEVSHGASEPHGDRPLPLQMIILPSS